MIKLTQKKIDWIIKEKKKGESTSEIASIMKITLVCTILDLDNIGRE